MLHKINAIFDRRQKLHFFFLLVSFLIGSFLELLAVYGIGQLVSLIMDPTLIETSRRWRLAAQLLGLETSDQLVVAACIAVAVIYAVKNIYLLFMYDLQYRYTCNNQARMNCELLSIYMEQDYLDIIEQNVAELHRSITTDVSMFFSLMLAILSILCEGFTAVALTLYLFIAAPVIMLSLAAVVTVAGFLFLKFYKKRMTTAGERIRTYAAIGNRWLLQAFNGIKEIKVLDREAYFQDRYHDAAFAAAAAGRDQNMNQVIARPVIEVASICGLLGIVALQIVNGAEPQKMAAVLSAFAIAAMRLLPSFSRIMSNISSVITSLPALDALYNDKRRADAMRRAAPRQETGDITLKTAIRIEGVRFTYPRKQDPVLDGVDLTIPKNSAVAFIGPSGAGKTTLADVILGLMEPQEGHIYADDNDVYHHLRGWHKIIAYIPQSIYLIDDTIRANVLFGLPEETADDEAIWAALRSAQMEAFVRAQPDGLDTRVGDRGVKLSGGQRQRIGIARALYHAPEVLVLDEATSALDTETETAVMDAINSLQGSKTLIIIAHRLSTVRGCDLIYEVRDGQVHKRTHAEVFGDEAAQPAPPAQKEGAEA